ncbi:EAL domain-containing protein [Thalassobaculum sp. OXR-137]|uniref:EAL domain-containing protein n=1 Tax=Thalassobaculum sp. OXR-137 TaxID=3100173 RepID=UPI002AC9B259|nr:EAL domain-containing protein [Thalassobaculum sp. OXR-137]WPZ32966.1 EAL domain-containing protein [Thalassobaculum sp. OXR-137]
MTGLTLASLYDTIRTLERVIGAFPLLIVATDRAGRIVMTTQHTRDVLGLSEVELLDRPIAAVIPGITFKLGGDPDAPEIAIGATRRRALRRDATAFTVDIQASAHRLGDDIVCVFALLDATDRLQADRMARDSRALLDAVLSGMPAMVSAKTPDGTYEFVNAYQGDVFGIDPQDAVGRSAVDLLGPEAGRPIDTADRRIATGAAISQLGPEKLIDADGRTRTFMTTRAAMHDAKGRVQRVLTVGIDVTHATAAEERLERLSLLDEMTGLPNRGALQQILSAQIRGAKRDGRRVGLVLLRVANLADFGIEFGSVVRDSVIRRLAIRLGGLVPETCVLSRFDDTTFALVVPNPEDAAAFEGEAARLVARGGRSLNAAGTTVMPKCRAGLAVYPDTGNDADTLLQAAEHGLRVQSRAPVAPMARGSRDIDSFFEARREAARALRRDLEHDRLYLRLLPMRSLADQELAGFQACLFDSLGRPLLGAPFSERPPDAALAAAAEGLAIDLCERLLRDSCHVAAGWARSPRISVPLTPDMLLQPDLVDIVGEVLERSRLPAGTLQLTIGETALGADPDSAADVLAALAGLGVDLGLTGFGAGGNPMLALARQPFGHVILSTRTLGPLDESVSAAIAFAQALGRTVGAEGVQTAEELAFLRDCGCTTASGAIFGAPLDPAAAEALSAGSADPAIRRA